MHVDVHSKKKSTSLLLKFAICGDGSSWYASCRSRARYEACAIQIRCVTECRSGTKYGLSPTYGPAPSDNIALDLCLVLPTRVIAKCITMALGQVDIYAIVALVSSLATIAVAARFWVRKLTKARRGADDWTILISVVSTMYTHKIIGR